MKIDENLSLRNLNFKIVFKVSLYVFLISYLILNIISIFYPTNVLSSPFLLVFERTCGVVAILITGIVISKKIEIENYLNGILGGLMFYIYGVFYFIILYGFENYLAYHNILSSVITTIFFGFLGFEFYKYNKKIDFYWVNNFVIFFIIWYLYFVIPGVSFSFSSGLTIALLMLIAALLGLVKILTDIKWIYKNQVESKEEFKNLFRNKINSFEVVKGFNIFVFIVSVGITILSVKFLPELLIHLL